MDKILDKIQSIGDLFKYRVNLPGQLEIVGDCLFDWMTPPDEPFNEMEFFRNPVGVAGKESFDTNMVLSGCLPSGVHFLVQGLQLGVFSAKRFGTTKAEKELKAGEVDLIIGNKIYIQYAPIGFFPPVWFDLKTKEYLKFYSGFQPVSIFPFKVDPYLLLESTQYFSLKLKWKNFITVPRIEKIGAMLFGARIRNSC
jgi:hypothetical protein